jgi:5-deoxy-glucuronate isomerase
MNDNDRWVKAAGQAGDDGYDVAIRPGMPGWRHTGLLVATLDDGQSRTIDTDLEEYLVVPLCGSFEVAVTDDEGVDHRAHLAGRPNVFAGPTDVAYVPRRARMTVTARGRGRVALALAVATKSSSEYAFRHITRDEVPVELRGAGVASREVRNFGTPSTVDADSIIACEVVTPAGNWSSYPPHKHDTERAGQETALEEIYYFLLAGEPDAPAGASAFGYQRVYSSGEPIDVLAEVRDDDVVLVPHGWHGPAMAPPGYDMYYLNVMAGPGEQRAWLICDDPAHAWVRAGWQHQQVDPRLPLHR